MAQKSPNTLNYNEFKRNLALEVMNRDEALDANDKADPRVREQIYARFYQHRDSLFADPDYAGTTRTALLKTAFKVATFWKTVTNKEALHGKQLADTNLLTDTIPAYRLKRY